MLSKTLTTLTAALLVASVIALPSKTGAYYPSHSHSKENWIILTHHLIVIERDPNSFVDTWIPGPIPDDGKLAGVAEAPAKRDTLRWPPPPICTPHPCHEEESIDNEDADTPSSSKREHLATEESVGEAAVNDKNVGALAPKRDIAKPPPPICSPHPCPEEDSA